MNSDQIADFWKWVQNNYFENQSPSFSLEKLRNDDVILSKINQQLRSIDPDLKALLHHNSDNDQNSFELIISPQGYLEVLNLAIKVASLCPLSDILPTRACIPRSNYPQLIQIDDQLIEASEIKFFLEEGRGLVNIVLGLPNIAKERCERYNELGYKLLDQILGEQDVILKVGEINVTCLGSLTSEFNYLPELASHFDNFVQNLATNMQTRNILDPDERVSQSFRRQRAKLALEISNAMDLEDLGTTSTNICEVVLLGESENLANELQIALTNCLGGISEVTPTITIIGPGYLISHSFLLPNLNGSEVFKTINDVASKAVEYSFELYDVQLIAK